MKQLVLYCFAVLFLTSCASQKEYGNVHNRYRKDRQLDDRRPTDDNATASTSTKVPAAKPVSQKTTTVATKAKKVADDDQYFVSEERTQLLITANKYLGTNYKSTGKNPGGFDCSGFTQFVFNQHGFKMSGGSSDLAKLGKHKSKDELEPGDMIFFGHDGRISHVGIVTINHKGTLEMIHSSSQMGVVKELINESNYWSSRFLFGRDVFSVNEN